MVQGMAFLSKKNFNPHNNANRKLVWEAQQKSRRDKERIQRRQEQLKREQEDEDLERVTKGEIAGSQAQLRFMYDAPPGMDRTTAGSGDVGNDDADNDDNSNNDYDGTGKSTCRASNDDDNKQKLCEQKQTDSSSSLMNLSKVKTGDDAATVEFRRILAAAMSNSSVMDSAVEKYGADNGTGTSHPTQLYKFTPNLQGMKESRVMEGEEKDGVCGNDAKNSVKKDSRFSNVDHRSALEKEVGRKNISSQNNLSYQQQIERFPQLKNAPMAAKPKDGVTDDGDAAMMVNFKPLGAQILHVRCMACGTWGHSIGDRSCPKSGWNPFALPAATTSSRQQQRSSSTTYGGTSIGSDCGNSTGLKHRSVERKNACANSDTFSHSEPYRLRKEKYKSNIDKDNSDESSVRRQRQRRLRHRQNKHRKNRDEDDRYRYNENSGCSSEDDSKLKPRKDRDYYDELNSGDDDKRRYRDRNQERQRDRKSSRKKKRKNYDRKRSSSKKTKKRSDDFS